MHHSVAHLVTATAYLVIGSVLLWLVYRVWWTHPVNRAFLFGPYVTPEGVKLILRNLPLVLLFGAFIFVCAVDHALDWFANRGAVPYDAVEGAAIAEAIISALTAVSVGYLTARFYYRRRG